MTIYFILFGFFQASHCFDVLMCLVALILLPLPLFHHYISKIHSEEWKPLLRIDQQQMSYLNSFFREFTSNHSRKNHFHSPAIQQYLLHLEKHSQTRHSCCLEMMCSKLQSHFYFEVFLHFYLAFGFQSKIIQFQIYENYL